LNRAIGCIVQVVFDSTNADDVQQMVDFLTSQTQSLLSQHGLQDAVSAGVTGLQVKALNVSIACINCISSRLLPVDLMSLEMQTRTTAIRHGHSRWCQR